MRDLPSTNNNANSKPPVQAKPPSQLTSTESLPDYRSYRSFLESYKPGKRSCGDDQESVSSTDSGISSSGMCDLPVPPKSAVINGTDHAAPFAVRTGSFRDYLENYNLKRYGPVKPVLANSNNSSNIINNKPTLKSELVIQIVQGEEQQQDEDTPPLPSPPKMDTPDYAQTTEIFCPLPPPPPLPFFAAAPPPPPLPLNGKSTPWTKKSLDEHSTTKSSQQTTHHNKLSNHALAADNLAKILKEHLSAREAVLSPESSPKKISVQVVSSRRSEESVPKSWSNNNSGGGGVDKNDPQVKKLVYSTYRGLLKQYNDKANDMVATLPRRMVREDNGNAKQLESIALQGGLEKLNGRTNPSKVDQDD